jgi:quercetin dioxygenase-like cupin family protein
MRTSRTALALSAAVIFAALHFSPAQSQSMNAPHHDMPDPSQGKQGIEHKALLRTDVVDADGQEVIVWDTEYGPRAINPRHYHPSAITFYIISGQGIWHEEGKEPVTLKAGDSLFVPAGTTHAHWNPSHSEKLRFLEFIVGPKDKSRPVPKPSASN